MPSQKTIFLILTTSLFVLLTLAPLVMLFPSVFNLDHAIPPWDWLIKKHIVSITLKSLYMALIAAGVALLIGLPLGLSMGAKENPFSSGFFLIYFLPLTMPPYLMANCWLALLSRGGLFPQTAHQWFGIDKTVNWLSGGWGAGMVLGFCYFPILAYLVISGLRASDPHHEEAGMFALSEWGILKKITLPLLLPHIGSGLILVFLLSITNYAVPALLGHRTFAVKIYTHFSVFQDSGGAVLLSVPLLVISAAAVLILGILMKDRAFFSINRKGGQGSILRLFQVTIFKLISHGPALMITAAPIVYLVMGTGSISNLTMAWDQSWGSILTSFWLALLSSFFITLLGFFAGYPLARVPLLRSRASRVLFLFPFALPSVLLAIGVIHLWNRPGLHWAYQSMLVLTILWGVKYLPLAQRTISDHIIQLPVEMEEAAFLCRLSWFRSFFRIVWPLTRPGFLVTWAITYIFCLAELGGTLLVIPPGVDTMPVRLYNVMHYGSSGVVAALGLFLLMMTVIPITLLLLCRRWLVKRPKL